MPHTYIHNFNCVGKTWVSICLCLLPKLGIQFLIIDAFHWSVVQPKYNYGSQTNANQGENERKLKSVLIEKSYHSNELKGILRAWISFPFYFIRGCYEDLVVVVVVIVIIIFIVVAVVIIIVILSLSSSSSAANDPTEVLIQEGINS